MPLIRKLEEEEWDIVSIVTDPVLLGEFLRNTADGSPTRDEWPKQKFGYRWYQKDLLTDKTEFISLVAGRAVGKCNSMHSRIYVHPYGYLPINEILTFRAPKFKHGPLTVYCMDPVSKELVQRRFKISKNGRAEVFRVTTAQGHIFRGTANHPLLTQRGYVMIQDLDESDVAAIATYLPHDTGKKEFTWEELRWLGYAAGKDHVRPEMYYTLKFQRNILEMQQIAKYFDARFERSPNGQYRLLRKRGPLKHYIRKLVEELHLTSVSTHGLRRIPLRVKSECIEQNKIFLEALFSIYAEFTTSSIVLPHKHKTFTYDIQELLLRLGVESRVESTENETWKLTVDDYYSYWKFFQELEIPGVSAKNLKLPLNREHPTEFMRFDTITEITSIGEEFTYAVTVQDHENYICDNLLVHNSLVLEDKIIYEALNVEDVFPVTKESTLVTANVSQMTPILDRLIMRLGNSPLLKDFLRGNINRSKGTLDFPQPGGSNYRMNARIAGSKGENNMVGLHVPKIIGDEMQIFPFAAFTQLGPTYNSWEPNAGQFYAGVPNGVREGSVLYLTDQRSPKFKKYRIPAHQNPYYSYEEDRENLLKYGGENSDDYQHLVLGKHGDPVFSIIPTTEPFDFWTHRYTQTDKHNGREYKQMLSTHKLPAKQTKITILAVDTGFTDPTIAQVIGQDDLGIWRTFARYRLTRITFPEQAEIIDWLDSYYNFNLICVDLGAGGGGIGLTQDLQSSRFSKSKRYDKRIYGVRFADYLDSGETQAGMPLKIQAKSYAGQELTRLITEKQLLFSELDMEGTSQMERVAYQRSTDGTNKYFVLSDRGTGKSSDDHIFASYIVFALALLTSLFEKPRRKLARPRW